MTLADNAAEEEEPEVAEVAKALLEPAMALLGGREEAERSPGRGGESIGSRSGAIRKRNALYHVDRHTIDLPHSQWTWAADIYRSWGACVTKEYKEYISIHEPIHIF
jgi:hypothetical protein